MLINTQDELTAFCARLAGERYIAVDTEFMRDRTYWPKLCLIQVAGGEAIAAIDPLAEGIDLAPLLVLLKNPKIIKVFHAARQDIEIFYHMTGEVPQPLADSQVMGMVCGYGEAVSYENLVSKVAKASIDKSSRFTDWSLRPLSERQLAYALDDVRHLRTVYEKLEADIEKRGRKEWIADEMAVLLNPGIYRLDPEEAWTRLKVRMDKPKLFTIVKDLAAWREREAQSRNVPRGRIIKDEMLMEIAHHLPEDVEALSRIRGLGSDFSRGKLGASVLEAIKTAKTRAPDALPDSLKKKPFASNLGPVVDMLKVLLRFVAEYEGVAPRLIATVSDLEVLAESDDPKQPVLSGWRAKIFGERALALKHGKLAMKLQQNHIEFVEVA
jgi:ribonuclease D